MVDFFSGKKTYIAGLAMIAYGVAQLVQLVPGDNAQELIWGGFVAIFLRQGIAKGPTA